MCRINDISWGTKGLDSGGLSKHSQLQDSWNNFKYLYVVKYILWNITIGITLVTLGSSYLPRFFITIIIIGIISFCLFIKIIIGVIYTIAYKFKSCCSGLVEINLTEESKISTLLH